jgi:hypothetical protein
VKLFSYMLVLGDTWNGLRDLSSGVFWYESCQNSVFSYRNVIVNYILIDCDACGMIGLIMLQI